MLKKLLVWIKGLMLKTKFTTVLGIFLKWLLRVGPKGAASHVKHFVAFDRQKIAVDISKEEREKEENFAFKNGVKFSVLVPLYNTPRDFLSEMIESVLGQTYKNFELCLADGSDNGHSFVGDVCLRYAQSDDRIKYRKLEKNKGISENTNECIDMATGDYIALFDHDDLLHPSALFKVAVAIEEENADFIYTDEFTFDGSRGPKAVIAKHYKPDFSYDNLLANNYICHFSVFRASLIDKVGGFRTKYDGSQDHDMILRLTSASKKIVHIPELLYFWRSHKNSVAMDIGSKMYAVESGINLVKDHLKEKGIAATVVSSPAFPTIYRINYEIKSNPLVSIIVSAKTEANARKTIRNILENTDYGNLEIVISVPKNFKTDFENVKVLGVDGDLAIPSVYNLSAKAASGDYLLFLNENAVPQNREWLTEMLGFAQLERIGAVGCKVINKNKTVKSIGKIIGFGDKVTAERYEGTDKSELGYFGKLFYSQNVSAVASDCFAIKKSDFFAVNGFDEEYQKSLFDTDICLKLLDKQKKNIVNPFAVVLSEGMADKSNSHDESLFKSKWSDFLEKGDPYFNKSLPEGYYYF